MSSPLSIEVQPSPPGLEKQYKTLFTVDCLQFLHDLISTFHQRVDQILQLRLLRKVHLDLSGELPSFSKEPSSVRSDTTWKVLPVPERLQRRHVDIGDLAPCDCQRFLRALKSLAQGIQVDFDDGNCPTFYNQIKGIYNVYKAVHNLFSDVPPISEAPVLMLRPRAWNMIESNMMVEGKRVPGPLFDFGLLMFHCGKMLLDNKSGPFFYLSKVESYIEARLWNDIFTWAQQKLTLPLGSIKATVLIENILASFEMEEILYELRVHSAGLNCGIWDYSASIVNKFGNNPAFLLPDRSKYVNMQKHFLRSYMDLLVQTCHCRGALATGGMVAQLLPHDPFSESYKTVIDMVTRQKMQEIHAGVDGFIVYDLNLIEPMQKGGVTLDGLKYNIAVGVLFIQAWLSGEGHFFYQGKVEDSATAEISRSQVWQWIRHQTKLEDEGKIVNRQLVTELTQQVMMQLLPLHGSNSAARRLQTAASMFLEVVLRRDFPEFFTTYLSQEHTFLCCHMAVEEKQAKL